MAFKTVNTGISIIMRISSFPITEAVPETIGRVDIIRFVAWVNFWLVLYSCCACISTSIGEFYILKDLMIRCISRLKYLQ